MTLQELIDTECNRVLDEICAARYLRKSDVQGRSIKPHLVRARRDTMKALFASGFRKADIARALKCHHGTVKFWIDDETRDRRREQANEYHRRRRGNHDAPRNLLAGQPDAVLRAPSVLAEAQG